jgi:glucosamine--fructose-6-phosphate aminotransferase (isomerizing)
LSSGDTFDPTEDTLSILDAEIREQPEALSRLLDRCRPRAEEIAAAIRAYGPRFVVIAARGSSDNAARYGQYLFGVKNGLTCALAAPSILTLYGGRPSMAGALVLGISQSGVSPDVVAVVAEARRQGALTAALTNDPTSPLARAAEVTVRLHAGEERAVAATKTYLAALGALAMLSAALAGQGLDELAAVPDLVADALARNAALGPAEAARFAGRERLVVLGRGFHYATAFELALKLKETSYVLAEASSTADFLHGPVALIETGLPALLVATGRTAPELPALLDQLPERVVISDRDDLLAPAALALPCPAAPDWLSPLVAVVPGQLFAVALARARGLDPDAPRGLRKVTETT